MAKKLNERISVDDRGTLNYILDTLSDTNKENLVKIIKKACDNAESFGLCDGLAMGKQQLMEEENSNDWISKF